MSQVVELPTARRAGPSEERIDVGAVARDLRDALEGDVRFDAQYRALYATDASNYRQVPLGVVLPRSKEDVEAALEVCRHHGAPVLGRGGGTSLAGQCCNVAVVFDFTRHMNRVLEVDPERRLARVEPGCVLDDLRDAAREHGLTFGPDPSTHDRCVLGGMIGNNSCGVHSVHAARYHGARTSDNLHRLEVLTWDGARFWTGPTDDDALEVILREGGRRADIHRALRELRDDVGDLVRERFPDIPRRVSGYNLDDLLPENGFHVARALAGTEGTCGLFLEAEVHLIPEPGARVLLVLGYQDVYRAADDVPAVLEHDPLGLEGMDGRLADYMRRKGLNTDDLDLLPDGDAHLLVELDGDDRDEAEARARALADAVARDGDGPSHAVFTDPAEQKRIWEVRESGLGATAFVPGMPDTWPGWEDTAVHPDDLGDYLRDFRALLDRYGYDASFYGHFGQGLLHVRIPFDLVHPEGIADYLRFGREVADLVAGYGGSLSGEHGDGQSRAAFLTRMFGGELVEAFRRFKAVWDPEGRMNPGKVVDARLPDEDLRLGTEWNPPAVETHFAFSDDGGDFSRAAMRCVGVGKCRRHDGGTMCPSYMVTRDEENSTRGRARLLFEMMRGDSLDDGWKSDEVMDALDLCLACKGCKADCPVSVDMATYKAEFSSHYYRRKLRPRTAYAMGLVHLWARLGSPLAPVANAAMRSPGLSSLLKWLGGIHPDREIPRLSSPTFRRRFRRERPGGGTGHATLGGGRGGPKVILWADTFNNYFHASTAMAGARVLEALGYDVVVPRRPLCCGRPLYDFGWLDRARRHWEEVLDDLRDEIVDGVPVVGVEPSCVAAFRDELPDLLHREPLAERLSKQTWLLGEFLDGHAADVDLPHLGGRALLHGHCHQKAVLDFGADRRILERMGMEVEVPDSGCCGMAGPFGFDRRHYEVAEACGERVLLPAVRQRDEEVVVVTDGFSCREMIRQGTGVRALNLAEVVWRALEERGGAGAVPGRSLGRAGPSR